MTARPDVMPPSKGISMIAAYRAERLNQRPVLRPVAQQPPVAGHPPQNATQPAAGPIASAPDFASLDKATAARATTSTSLVPPPVVPPVDPAASPAAGEASLASIGLGPAMCIRLHQLGLHSTTDLAQAHPAQLRAALGDISRLVDVEAWIDGAQRAPACAAESSRPA